MRDFQFCRPIKVWSCESLVRQNFRSCDKGPVIWQALDVLNKWMSWWQTADTHGPRIISSVLNKYLSLDGYHQIAKYHVSSCILVFFLYFLQQIRFFTHTHTHYMYIYNNWIIILSNRNIFYKFWTGFSEKGQRGKVSKLPTLPHLGLFRQDQRSGTAVYTVCTCDDDSNPETPSIALETPNKSAVAHVPSTKFPPTITSGNPCSRGKDGAIARAWRGKFDRGGGRHINDWMCGERKRSWTSARYTTTGSVLSHYRNIFPSCFRPWKMTIYCIYQLQSKT